MTGFVKICGINSNKSLEAVVSAGADAVGLVIGVPRSPRNISLLQAKELRRRVQSSVKSILVMVPRDLDTVIHAIKYVKPDMVQLHNIDFNTSNLDVPVIRAINNRTGLEKSQRIASECDLLLLDSYHKDKYGGTGKSQDLDCAERVIKQLAPHPVILAGGLNPGNVSEAIRRTNPYGVDVSSGVEKSPGGKDAEKIRAFVEAARNIGEQII